MERPQHLRPVSCLFLLLLLTVSATRLTAQQNPAIYQAYIEGRMDRWEDILLGMEAADPAGDLERVNYYYGFIGYLIGTGQHKKAKLYIEKGEKIIESALKADPKNATALAFKGSFIGFKLAMSKIKAVVLGPESMQLINKAVKTGPDNVQALADKGNLLYYSPGIVGGNKKEAASYVDKAVGQIRAQGRTEGNWFYLNLLVTAARFRAETGRKEEAREIYEEILRAEPRFQWVRDELYPEVLQK